MTLKYRREGTGPLNSALEKGRTPKPILRREGSRPPQQPFGKGPYPKPILRREGAGPLQGAPDKYLQYTDDAVSMHCDGRHIICISYCTRHDIA